LFLKETIRFTNEWYKKTTKEYITKYHEVALSLSEEKISQMKSKVNELVRNSEKIVKKEIDSPSLWWHQEPHLHDPIDKYKQVADRSPESLDTSLRHVLGYLGSILEAFGFSVSASGNTTRYSEFWFDRSSGRLETAPFYPHILKWSGEMLEIIHEYDDQYIVAIALFNEIHVLKEEKRKQEALARWDSQ